MYEMSIVIPAYNKGLHLENTLLSLSIQTLSHERWEVLCIDDGSTDHTRRVVDEARKQYPYHIRYFYLNRPQKGSQALPINFGVKRATAPIICHVSADVLLARDALALHLAYHQDSEQNLFVFGQCYMIHSRMAQALLPSIPWQQDIHQLESLFIEPYHHSAYWRTPMHASLHKAWFERVRGYDEDWPTPWSDDWDFWVRVEALGVMPVNAIDAFGAHQFHRQTDHDCYRGCLCPLWQKSGTWPCTGSKYDGLPEDIIRNKSGWGEYEDSYEA